MTDIADWLNDTHREIGRRRIAAGEARTALMRRHYDASIEDVWAACTEPDRLNRWFLPVSGDLRVGGRFQLEGNASGEILRCEPPRLLTVTWAYADRPVDEVELRLAPGADGDTVLELEHGTVSGLVEWEGREVDVIPGLGSGWEPALFALHKHLRGELPDVPAAEWPSQASPAELDVIAQLTDRVGQAWAELVEAANAPKR